MTEGAILREALSLGLVHGFCSVIHQKTNPDGTRSRLRTVDLCSLQGAAETCCRQSSGCEWLFSLVMFTITKSDSLPAECKTFAQRQCRELLYAARHAIVTTTLRLLPSSGDSCFMLHQLPSVFQYLLGTNLKFFVEYLTTLFISSK